MAVLTPGQVYVCVRGAGWTGNDAITATAVALAESSGSTTITSKNPDGGVNVGLFQLDTPHGEGSGYTVAQLQDPALNAKVAYAAWVADGKTFTKHWSSATNGAAQAQQVTAANAATAAAPGGGATGGVAGTVTSLVKLTEQAAGLLQWLTVPANWGRVALVLVGAVLAVAGLNAVAKPVTAPVVAAGKKIAKTAAVAAA
jgi:hypothetical protein